MRGSDVPANTREKNQRMGTTQLMGDLEVKMFFSLCKIGEFLFVNHVGFPGVCNLEDLPCFTYKSPMKRKEKADIQASHTPFRSNRYVFSGSASVPSNRVCVTGCLVIYIPYKRPNINGFTGVCNHYKWRDLGPILITSRGPIL